MKVDGDRAGFQLSLDIPTEVVDWDGLSYTRTRCFCNADEIPLTLSLSAPVDLTACTYGCYYL